MVDGGDGILQVLLVEQPGLEVRLGRVVTAFVDDLQEGAQRLLVAPLAEQFLAAPVIGVVDLAAKGRAIARLATGRQQQRQERSGQMGGEGATPPGASGKGLNAGNSGLSSPHADFQHKS